MAQCLNNQRWHNASVAILQVPIGSCHGDVSLAGLHVSLLEPHPGVELLGPQTGPDQVIRETQDLGGRQPSTIRGRHGRAAQAWNAGVPKNKEYHWLHT